MSQCHHAITVRFDQLIDLSRRVTLVERLQRLRGVVSAIFDSSDERNLTVRLQENSLSAITLLDYLTLQGLIATVASPQLADSKPFLASR